MCRFYQSLPQIILHPSSVFFISFFPPFFFLFTLLFVLTKTSFLRPRFAIPPYKSTYTTTLNLGTIYLWGVVTYRIHSRCVSIYLYIYIRLRLFSPLREKVCKAFGRERRHGSTAARPMAPGHMTQRDVLGKQCRYADAIFVGQNELAARHFDMYTDK